MHSETKSFDGSGSGCVDFLLAAKHSTQYVLQHTPLFDAHLFFIIIIKNYYTNKWPAQFHSTYFCSAENSSK